LRAAATSHSSRPDVFSLRTRSNSDLWVAPHNYKPPSPPISPARRPISRSEQKSSCAPLGKIFIAYLQRRRRRRGEGVAKHNSSIDHRLKCTSQSCRVYNLQLERFTMQVTRACKLRVCTTCVIISKPASAFGSSGSEGLILEMSFPLSNVKQGGVRLK